MSEWVDTGWWDDLLYDRWERGVGEVDAVGEAHLSHVLAMYPQIPNPDITDISTPIEVDLEEIGTGLCKGGDGFIVYGFNIAELDSAEKVTVFGEGGHALWRY